MFRELLPQLTTEQKRALRIGGVSDQLLCDWRAGRRLPTEPQVVILAAVAEVSRHQLQDEMALARASDTQRPLIERALEKGGASVGAMLACGAVAAAGLALSSGRMAEVLTGAAMYRRSGSDRRKREQSGKCQPVQERRSGLDRRPKLRPLERPTPVHALAMASSLH